MSILYLDYCKLGSKYYEKSDRSEIDFTEVETTLPATWQRVMDLQWCHFVNNDEEIPDQGWKIHVSACPENAAEILAETMEHCFAHGLTFKFIRSPHVLFQRNSKYGERSASGKFITIYPTESRLAETLDGLDERIGGKAGPYILSDLRYRSGPLYVRYGGYRQILSSDSQGNVVECIRDPNGELVPDNRTPVFRPPEWAEIPECLESSMAARAEAKLTDFPYRIKHALHFSNGGGVYEAMDLVAGDDVILKEARPYAGLDSAGRDAVARLEHARAALEQLAEVPVIPNVRAFRKGHEHQYLIRDHVPGDRLTEWISSNNPIFGGNTTYSRRDYVTKAMDYLRQLEALIAEVHDAGVVFGDLHPDNVIVSAQGRLALIDFEACSQVDNPQPQAMAAPGFVAPPTYKGVQVDHYALACLKLTVFLPLPILLQWGDAKLDLLLTLLDEYFELPSAFLHEIRSILSVEDRPMMTSSTARQVAPMGAHADIGLAVTNLIASATPGDPTRLYPGDIAQFVQSGGQIGVGHGAAGVLYALKATDTPIPSDHVSWLIDTTRRAEAPPVGFWNGLSGIAYVLEELGLRDEADEVMERCLAIPSDPRFVDLASGDPGVALTLLHLAQSRQDKGYLDEALRRAPTVDIEFLVSPASKMPGGLLSGPGGLALVEHLLAVATGDDERINRATGYLSCDMQRMGLFSTAEGALAPFHRPSLLTTCGTLLVANRMAEHVVGGRVTNATKLITHNMQNVFCNSIGLLGGRAGVLATLSGLDEPWVTGEIERHVRELQWHHVAHDEGMSFLGELGLRLSEDLATGSAGVVVALQSALVAKRPLLPFLTCANEPLAGSHTNADQHNSKPRKALA